MPLRNQGFPPEKPSRLASISLKGLFRGNPTIPAATPPAGPGLGAGRRAGHPPVFDPAGDPANPAKTIHFDPADPLGTEPTGEELDDYVGSTIDKLAAAAWQRASSAQSSRGTPSFQVIDCLAGRDSSRKFIVQDAGAASGMNDNDYGFTAPDLVQTLWDDGCAADESGDDETYDPDPNMLVASQVLRSAEKYSRDWMLARSMIKLSAIAGEISAS